MALIICLECENKVSDKAYCCPQCGFPVNDKEKNQMLLSPKKAKRKRLPNGFGRITKLSQSLRHPYRAMITVGKDPFGKPIGKILGYFKTYNEAYSAIIKYHEDPYTLEKTIKFFELYKKWSTNYFEGKNINTIRTITAAWAYTSEIYNMEVGNIRSYHLKNCINNASRVKDGKVLHASAGTKSRIKSMLNLIFDYACEYEISEKNYARMFHLDNEITKEKLRNKNDHIPFSDDEIKKIHDAISVVPFADMIYIGIYTGFRPQELSDLDINNIDVESRTIRGGMKTSAGTNRLVPIHDNIFDIIVKNIEYAKEIGSNTLFNDVNSLTGSSMTYDKYRNRFIKVMERLKIKNHRPHDTRHTYITLAKKYGVDEYTLKRIVGHTITDLTENVYTHRDIEWLKSENEKIK